MGEAEEDEMRRAEEIPVRHLAPVLVDERERPADIRSARRARGRRERQDGGDAERREADEEGRERHREPPQPVGRGHPRSLQKHQASAATAKSVNTAAP